MDELLKIKEESFNKKISNSNPYVKLARESLNYYFKNKRLMIPVGMTETLSHLLKQEMKRLWQYFLSEAESFLAGIISI